MGSTRSHPLPPGIFVKMPSPPLARSQPISAWYNEAETIVAPSEFDEWTEKDFDDEIKRLQKRVKELETEKIKKRVDRALVWDDDDNIMNDPDVREMVNNGEHICHMFDGECLALTRTRRKRKRKRIRRFKQLNSCVVTLVRYSH